MENKLEKKYGLFTAICMVVGIVVGSGVFFKAQVILQKTGGDMPLGVLAWLIGGAIMIVCILAFSAMAQKYEKVNGRRILFFSDSVQALGKTGLDLKGSGIDGASFSAHKINGPRGVGLLYAKNPEIIRPIASAGGQEKGRRGGTENLPGIAAFDEALSEWMETREEDEKRISHYNFLLRDGLGKLGIEILSPLESTPYILSVVAPLPSEVFTRMLMDKGFCVSSGSACSNNAKGKSEGILEAMGIQNQKAKKAIRISMGRNTTEEEVIRLLEAFGELIDG